MALAQLIGRVRAKFDSYTGGPSGGSGPVNINSRGDVLIAQGVSPRGDVTRMRNSYMAVAANAVAPVVALPTTAALITLWNGEPDGGRIYVIESCQGFCSTSAAAATNIGLVGCLNIVRKATPSTNTLTPRGLAGQVYKGLGVVATGQTITNDCWHPIGNSVTGPASQIGLTIDYPVNGLYIVPPGFTFSLSVIANTVTTIAVKMGLKWHEVFLPIGQ